ncbi:putative uroporphyrinogen decarboxylase 1, chloroplastic-like [Capsicum annuum]|uniref:uncharacterized protein LOC107844094 n=1 Tax=Capsicum annuum TaxID=4072 RepID=UPI001FB0B18F|nr:uncharacterized protein LOC107844094 [Capsicum annuum]KAF3658068.1 putative uroporphyrinogen decarboxylase 1, chloroplastic-like [Capsicum annuum]
MAHFPMNPYDEQRLIQEVHYLHSLWHQGPPPHPHHPPYPHPYPYLPQPHYPTPLTLHPTSSTQFKKRNNKKKKKSRKLKESEIQDSGIEWISSKSPTESPPPVNESGWPSFKPQIKKQPHLPTDQELATVEANKVQQQALKAVSEYLKYSKNADDDEDDEEYDDDDDDVEVEEEDKGEKNVSFFAKLFEEDVGLKEYYVKNSESGVGEFSCLVCCGVGKKGWKKRFKDCVALVQHSITIANAREAHRAYGKVICRVLGWDINRLPSIVLTAGDKTGESSGKLAEAQVLGSGLQTSSLVSSNDGSNKTLQGIGDDSGKDGLDSLSNATDTVNIGSDELSQQKQSFSNESQQENGGGSMAPEHKSPVEASVSNGIPETAKENTEGASNCLGNEGDGGKSNLSGQSNTSDTVNIGSNEMSQQKEPLDNENGQETGGNSTALEHNSMSEANANISLENVSNDAAETAEENEEGVFDCLEPLQEGMIVADEETGETTIASDMS